MSDLGIILQNIDRLLKVKGLTANKASELAGRPDAIRNIRRKLGGGIKGSDVTSSILKDLARVLDTTYEELTTPYQQVQVRPVAGLREEIMKRIDYLDRQRALAIEDLEALDRAEKAAKKPVRKVARR